MNTELRGGLLLPDEAIRLAVDLEARGHVMTHDGQLHVSDGKRLTAEDIAAIKRLRHHLIAIAAYSPEATSDDSRDYQPSGASEQSAVVGAVPGVRPRSASGPVGHATRTRRAAPRSGALFTED